MLRQEAPTGVVPGQLLTRRPPRSAPEAPGRERGKAAATGKGFGSVEAAPSKKQKKKKGAPPSGSSEDAVVKEALRDAKGRRARPVDPREAAKGRLDFAQVKSWGSGRPEDLGSLQVAKYVTSGAGSGGPLYEVLGRHLEELGATGSLEVAQPANAPTPPFERWTFRPRRYLAWLKDQHCLHSRLEAAMEAALQTDPGGDRGAYAALRVLGAGSGLSRVAELAGDLRALQQAFPDDAREARETPNGLAYGTYLHDIGRTCVEHEVQRERERAVLRLFGNAYAAYVTHLTGGMRVGAAAGEKLNLFAKGATAFYQSWQALPQQDPLARLKQQVNAAGQLLNSADELKLKVELGRAMPKVMALMNVLAVQEGVLEREQPSGAQL